MNNSYIQDLQPRIPTCKPSCAQRILHQQHTGTHSDLHTMMPMVMLSVSRALETLNRLPSAAPPFPCRLLGGLSTLTPGYRSAGMGWEWSWHFCRQDCRPHCSSWRSLLAVCSWTNCFASLKVSSAKGNSRVRAWGYWRAKLRLVRLSAPNLPWILWVTPGPFREILSFA